VTRYAQTAKEAFGSDAVVDSVGSADAAHTSGTAVVGAPMSLTQIFSEGPTFAAIEQNWQDQERLHLPLDFFREALITKDVFQSPERCCSLFDALVDVGV
jgi:hypothetical protein